MIMKVFSVFDTKVAVFGQPWFDQRVESALRGFGDAVNDGSNPNNMWNKHPEDFQLFEVGEFDTDSGVLTGRIPKAVVHAAALFRGNISPSVNGVSEKDKEPVN